MPPLPLSDPLSSRQCTAMQMRKEERCSSSRSTMEHGHRSVAAAPRGCSSRNIAGLMNVVDVAIVTGENQVGVLRPRLGGVETLLTNNVPRSLLAEPARLALLPLTC